MILVTFILIWLCSFAIHLVMTYYGNKYYICTIGDLIYEIEFYMWCPLINTLALIVISIAFVAVRISTLLKLGVLWEKFKNIKLNKLTYK